MLNPPVPTDIQLFMVLCGFMYIAIGLAWLSGRPRHKSAYGLQFKIAMDSKEVWETLHRRSGRILIACGLWWLIPFTRLKDALTIQIPLGGAGTILGILLIKYLLEKRHPGR